MYFSIEFSENENFEFLTINVVQASESVIIYTSVYDNIVKGTTYHVRVQANTEVGASNYSNVLMYTMAAYKQTSTDKNDKGNQRAQLLTKYFTTNKDVTKFGTPAAIYAMGRATPTMGSLRPLETVTTLATSLGISVNSNYKKNDYQAMAQEILSKPEYFGKMVLICWEHNILPQVVDAFGYTAAPQSWPGSPYFNRTWVLDFTNGKPTSFRDFNQQLFPDDE